MEVDGRSYPSDPAFRLAGSRNGPEGLSVVPGVASPSVPLEEHPLGMKFDAGVRLITFLRVIFSNYSGRAGMVD